MSILQKIAEIEAEVGFYFAIKYQTKLLGFHSTHVYNFS